MRANRAAAAEAFRVLRPGGQLLLLEHVRSPAPIVRAGQTLLLEPLAVRFEADHLLREPLDFCPASGLRSMRFSARSGESSSSSERASSGAELGLETVGCHPLSGRDGLKR